MMISEMFVRAGRRQSLRPTSAPDVGAPELTWQAGDDIPSPFGKGTSGVASWLAGVPFLYTEATGAGGLHPHDIKLYADGVRNLLAHLGLRPGGSSPPPDDQVLIEDTEQGSSNIQHQGVTPVGGLFHASVDLYDAVSKGQLLGTIVDLFGNVLHELRSTKDGVVITIRHVPRVQAGDALVNIAPGAGPPEY